MKAPVLVIGATSMVGPYLIGRLDRGGYDVHAVSRQPRPEWVPQGVTWTVADVDRGLPAVPAGTALIHLAPLWLAPPLVRGAAAGALRHVVAFGSTSRFTKARSSDPAERALAARLTEAEAALPAACASAAVPWTLLRPTLIYGGGRDGNVSLIAAFIHRFGFFPVAGPARGRRQPVHADDLAAAAVASLRTDAAHNKAYDLGGGETLDYREMVVRIFGALGRPPRVLTVPPMAYRAALRAARHREGWRHLTPSMADRMAEDLSVDHADAVRDLGYSPRPFAYRGSR